MNTPRYLKNVTTLAINETLCVGCGLCAEVCPHGVFEIKERKSRIVERDACMECGACARNCPVEAIRVKSGVGCAVGILNAALGWTSSCCGEEQACCCDESERD